MNDQPPDTRPGSHADPEPTPTRPLPPDHSQDPATDQAPASPGGPTGRLRLTDRSWSFAALVAVALVSLLLGGLAGAGLAKVADPDDGRFGPGHDRFDRRDHLRPPGMRNDRWRERWHDRRDDRRGPWDLDDSPTPTPAPGPMMPTPSR